MFITVKARVDIGRQQPFSYINSCHRFLFIKNLFYLLQITFKNEVGQYDLEVTTFQLAVLFAWNQRPREKISFENLKLATELPDAELRRTLWVGLCFFVFKIVSSQVAGNI